MTKETQSPLVAKINQVADVIAFVTNILSVITGGLMTLVVICGVFARYVMQNPMVWTEEIARMAMIWTAYLGMSVATRRRGHLGVVFVVKKMPLLLQRIVKLLTDSMIVVFLYIIIIKGVEMVVNAKVQIEPATGIIMSYPFAIVPISGALMLMQQLMVMAGDLIRWNTDADPFEVKA